MIGLAEQNRKRRLESGHAVKRAPVQPAYLRIADELCTEVRVKDLAPDDRLGSQREFSKRFDVSSITVEAALKELQDRGVVYRVRGRGTFVAGKSAAPRVATLRIGVVGHAHTNWEMNLYVRDIFQAIESYARESECLVRFIEQDVDFARLLDERAVDGLVLITPYLESLRASGLDRSRHAYAVIGEDYDRHPCVTIDNDGLVRAALDHLAGLGHRDIALLTDPLTAWDTSCRWEAFRNYHAQRGWVIRPEWVLHWPGWLVQTEAEEDEVFSRFCGRQRPSAILALGTFFGADVIRLLEKRGVRVPEDLSVLGLDLPPFGTPGRERLTAMVQPTADIGYRAMDLVARLAARQAETETRVVLKCELRQGATTAQPATKRR
jgi:DNA-binding LacI/PurR family transcriptional regulator